MGVKNFFSGFLRHALARLAEASMLFSTACAVAFVVEGINIFVVLSLSLTGVILSVFFDLIYDKISDEQGDSHEL